ncbi:MAG: IS3 family transposase [Bacilli bacterium]|nr:IS3 family transposase [Bacilli bacterium]
MYIFKLTFILEPQPLEQVHISIYELKQLKKKIKHYETTIDIYEKTQCTKTSPLSQRLEAMKKVEKEFSHASLCRTLDVKKGTFLNHLYRKVEETQLEKEDKIYKDKLTELFHLHEGRLGSIKLSKIMTQQGFRCSQNRASRILKELGLESTRTIRAKKIIIPHKSNYKQFRNELKRKFNPTEPNKVWVSDFTQFNVDYQQKYYVCIIMDLFARKVIGYSIANNCKTEVLEKAFENACEVRTLDFSQLIFHSDQGTQYTEFCFIQRLKNLGITQSFSTPGNPYDNAVIESFFSCLKREQLYIYEMKTFEDFVLNVEKYINYYNEYRPHKTLKYKTPNQVEKEFGN